MDALDQMFHILVRNLRAKQPALLSAPFTVAEIHQQILPYRHFRRDLGLETNQEYEMTLMELLSGARGYLDVDEQLRDELGKELTSRSPEPSRVREFAEAHVTINPAALAKISDPRSRAEADGAARGATTPISTKPAAVTTPSRIGETPASAAPGAAPVGHDSTRCRYCGGDLPIGQGRVLHFCPHCGQNLQVLNCSACGAEVEAGWRFCVACGKAVA
jgi:predicted RNA-binding Zn-ribbon protein involved in translation (DUF1610 family)